MKGEGLCSVFQVVGISSWMIIEHELVLLQVIKEKFFIALSDGDVLFVDEYLVLPYDIDLIDGYHIGLVDADEIFRGKHFAYMVKALNGIKGFIAGFDHQVIVHSFDVVNVIEG